MVDLHTHSFLSDGQLIPSELVRRVHVAGYRAVAITDHVDESNINVVLEGLVTVSGSLNKYWDISVLPGVEITHAPLEAFPLLVSHARKKGAKIVVGHGESPVEPVLPGTNMAAIMAGVDILAHPGFILEDDACLAAEKNVYLEITLRGGHSKTNQHVLDMAVKAGAGMVLNSDLHSPGDIMSHEKRDTLLRSLTDSDKVIEGIIRNSDKIIENLK